MEKVILVQVKKKANVHEGCYVPPAGGYFFQSFLIFYYCQLIALLTKKYLLPSPGIHVSLSSSVKY